MYRIYYNKIKDFTIVDVSGMKPLKLIEKEFGKCKYQTIDIDPQKEEFVVSEGKLSKKKITK